MTAVPSSRLARRLVRRSPESEDGSLGEGGFQVNAARFAVRRHPVTQSPSYPVTQSPRHPVTQSPIRPSDFVIFPSLLPRLFFSRKWTPKRGKKPQKSAKNCKKVSIRACPSYHFLPVRRLPGRPRQGRRVPKNRPKISPKLAPKSYPQFLPRVSRGSEFNAEIAETAENDGDRGTANANSPRHPPFGLYLIPAFLCALGAPSTPLGAGLCG